MKLNLNKPFINLEQTAFTDSNMGQTVASAISNFAQGDALKFWGWATALYGKNEITIDESDEEVLKKFINETKGQDGFPIFNVLMRAQLLKEISSQKEKQEAKKKTDK